MFQTSSDCVSGIVTHPCAAEGIPQEVERCDWRPKEIVGEEDEEPVLDDARNVHRQCAGLPNEQKHRLCTAAQRDEYLVCKCCRLWCLLSHQGCNRQSLMTHRMFIVSALVLPIGRNTACAVLLSEGSVLATGRRKDPTPAA